MSRSDPAFPLEGAPDIPYNIFTTARRAVFGDGPIPADIMFVGEAPGAGEDAAGRPFIGRSGKLLGKILERFTETRRSWAYVTNVVKHRPPDNRTPYIGEMRKYLPYLHHELKIVQPRVVVTLGATALKMFDRDARLKSDHGLARHVTIDGVWEGVVVPWYHPAYILRQQGMMPTMIADAQRLTKEVRDVNAPTREPEYELVQNPSDVASMLLGQWGEFGFDTETTSPSIGKVFCTDLANMVGFSVSTSPGSGIYVPTYEVGEAMAAVLSSPIWTKVCHNAKFELKVLRHQGVEMVNYEDTKIAAYLLGESSTGLKDLAKRYLGDRPTEIRELWPEGISNQPREVAFERYQTHFTYAAADADNTLKLWPSVKTRLETEGLWPIYEMEKKMIPVLADMEHVGMNVNAQACEDTGTMLQTLRESSKALVLYEARQAGQLVDDFNINSAPQLEALLTSMGAPMHKLTISKARYSVAADVLDDLRPWWPTFLEPLLAYRKYGKMSTYVDTFIKLRGPDGRLHTSFNQAGHWEETGAIDPASSPATGRLSSSGPNLMNIPHHRATVGDVDWSVPIRACLIPTPGWKFISIDLGQEEPRIVAVIANDKTLLQGFADGRDIYRPATEALYPYTADGTADREWKSRWDAHERFV